MDHPRSSVAGRRSLAHSISWHMLGTAVYAACQWGVLIVMARVGSTEAIGHFALSLGIVAPIFVLFDLHLKALYITDIENRFRHRDYLVTRAVATGFALVAILTLAAVTSDNRTEMALLICLGLAKACQAISNSLHGFQQRLEKVKAMNLSLMIQGGLSVLLTGIGLGLTGNAVAAGLGMLAASVITLVTIDIPAVLRLPGFGRAASLRVLQETATAKTNSWHRIIPQIASQGLILSLTSALLSLAMQMPRYAIANYMDASSLGIYAALAYITVACSMIITALGNSIGPRLASWYATGKPELFHQLVRRSVGAAAAVVGLMLVGVVFAQDHVISLIYGRAVESQGMLLTLLFAGVFVSSVGSVLGYTATAARIFYVQPVIASLAVAVTFSSSCWLVPAHGLYGAVAGQILGQTTILAGYALVYLHLSRSFSVQPEKKQELLAA